MYYKNFRTDIENIGYKVNPYDVCVVNKRINGKQHTITWHVDDVKAIHVNPKVNDNFHKLYKEKYRNDELGHVTVIHSNEHNYLEMNLDYSNIGKLKLEMKDYIKNMVEEFPHEIKRRTTVLWNDKLF